MVLVMIICWWWCVSSPVPPETHSGIRAVIQQKNFIGAVWDVVVGSKDQSAMPLSNNGLYCLRCPSISVDFTLHEQTVSCNGSRYRCVAAVGLRETRRSTGSPERAPHGPSSCSGTACSCVCVCAEKMKVSSSNGIEAE